MLIRTLLIQMLLIRLLPQRAELKAQIYQLIQHQAQRICPTIHRFLRQLPQQLPLRI